VPPVLRFAAPVVEVALSVGGRIELGPAIRLASGMTTRWAGSFDLLDLARLAGQPIPRLLLTACLQEGGLSTTQAASLLRWAVANGVLVDAAPPG